MSKQILTKSVLRQIISEEVKKQIHMNEKQSKLNESPLDFIMNNPESLAGIVSLVGILGAAAKSTFDKIKQARNQGEKESILKTAIKAARASAGEGVSAIEKATGANTMGQGIGGNR